MPCLLPSFMPNITIIFATSLFLEEIQNDPKELWTSDTKLCDFHYHPCPRACEFEFPQPALSRPSNVWIANFYVYGHPGQILSHLLSPSKKFTMPFTHASIIWQIVWSPILYFNLITILLSIPFLQICPHLFLHFQTLVKSPTQLPGLIQKTLLYPLKLL